MDQVVGGPKCSREVTLASGRVLTFPTLDDYAADLIARGVISQKSDLFGSHSRHCSEIMFDWFRRGQLACQFAVWLARFHGDPPWDTVVEVHPFADLADRLNVRLDTFVNGGGEAAQVVLPTVRTAADVVELINALCKDDRWRWWELPDNGTNSQGALLVALRWVLPSKKSVNLVLGFADLETMPITRRSPFTALVIRTSDFKRTPDSFEGGFMQVHLADMDSKETPARHEKLQKATEKVKTDFVPQAHPQRGSARARVTFALPMPLKSGLCDPRPPENWSESQ